MRRLIVVGTMLLASATWASAGWADTTKTININPGSLGKTADKYSQICDPNQGGNPPAGMDMWVFNLPSQGNNPGVFVSVTATWDTGNGSKTLTIPADGGAISAPANNGTSKAWIAVPEGWKLTAASAVVTGGADMFVVTHTCTETGTTPPTTKPPGGGDPDPDPDPSSSASAGTPGGGGSLPLTGTTTTVLLALGGIAIAGGAALRYFYRRRRPII